MNKKRRSMLGGGSILGLGLLSGCVAPGGSAMGLPRRQNEYAGPPENLYTSIFYSDGSGSTDQNSVRSYLYNADESVKSRKIFETVVNKKFIPQQIELPSEYQVEKAISYFNDIKSKYDKKTTLNIDEGYEVAQNIIPLLRIYLDLNSIDIFSQKKPEGDVLVSKDGTLNVPPGFYAITTQRGYCLDKSYPAPHRGDAMRLEPISELIPEELLPLYRALQKAGVTNSPFTAYKYQGILWILRSAGQPGGLATQISTSTLKDMEDLLPGGAKLFVDYHNAHYGEQNKKAQSTPTATKKAAPVKEGPPEYSISGLLNTLSGNGDRNRKNNSTAEDMARAFFEGMNKQQPQNGKPNNDRNYQMLDKHVASYTIGDSGLTPQIHIINTGDTPFRINYMDWMATPIRPLQRVAMGPISPSNILYQKLTRAIDPESLAKLEKLKNKIAPYVNTELARFILSKTFDKLSQNKLFQDWILRGLMKNPVVQNVLPNLPYVGSLISAYEAMSGKNWLNGRDLNAFERAASFCAIIPGTSILKGAFRDRANAAFKLFFGAAGFATNQHLTQFLGEEVNAYAETYSNPLRAAFNYGSDKFADSMNQTIIQLYNDRLLPKPFKSDLQRIIENRDSSNMGKL